MTIEEVKTEYFRIEELTGKTALTGTQYDAEAKKGFSVFMIKRDMGLSYNQMKHAIGAEIASSSNNKGGTKDASKKIFCARGEGQMISTRSCLPGCNDECLTCEEKQVDNVGAGGYTLTPEEDKEAMLIGTHRSSGVIAVEEGHSEL